MTPRRDAARSAVRGQGTADTERPPDAMSASKGGRVFMVKSYRLHAARAAEIGQGTGHSRAADWKYSLARGVPVLPPGRWAQSVIGVLSLSCRYHHKTD
jgi:hypothetical protein